MILDLQKRLITHGCTITHDLEIWLISTKNISKLFWLTQYYSQSKFSHISYMEAIKVQCPLQPVPKLVMKPNCTCLLLTPLLSPLIIWLAEMLTLLRKVHF